MIRYEVKEEEGRRKKDEVGRKKEGREMALSRFFRKVVPEDIKEHFKRLSKRSDEDS